MLETTFLQVLNMSFTASVVIMLVLAVRLLLRRAPKVYSYALWAVVLFRLVCPFSLESMFSLLPTKANPIAADIGYMAAPRLDTGVTAVDKLISLPPAIPYASVNPLQIWIAIGSVIWISGVILLLAYSILSLLQLHKRLSHAVYCKDNIFTADTIDTAFVLGIFRPRIYLPQDLCETETAYILLHEQMHIKRFDHMIKIVGFMVLCVHWFNPLVWLAYFLSAKDMEMSCDEAVIKELGDGIKQAYSASLLTLATGKRAIGGTPLAFGEGSTKGRIKNVLNHKKPAFWVIAAAVAVTGAAAVGLLTNPLQPSAPPASVDLSDIAGMNIGAEMPDLVYGDNERIILHGSGTCGLIIYDLTERRVVDRISYSLWRQWGMENYMYAVASPDGKYVYLADWTMDVLPGDFIYAYNVEARDAERLTRQPTAFFTPNSLFGVDGEKYAEFTQKYADFRTDLISYTHIDLGDSFYYLRADADWSMESLALVRRSYADGAGESYLVFGEAGTPPTPVAPIPAEPIYPYIRSEDEPSYLYSLSEEERKQTEQRAIDYFTKEAPYYGGIKEITPASDNSTLYQNKGIEGNYTPGNIIIYEVWTVTDANKGNPPRTISIARDTPESDWKVISQGY